MFRQLGRLLFLLALWLQILAPVAAAQIQPADGPLVGVPICGHVGGSGADGASDTGDHHGMAAPLCGLCCAAVTALDAPPPAAIPVALAWTRHVFAASAAATIPGAKPDLPRARDPPTLA